MDIKEIPVKIEELRKEIRDYYRECTDKLREAYPLSAKYITDNDNEKWDGDITDELVEEAKGYIEFNRNEVAKTKELFQKMQKLTDEFLGLCVVDETVPEQLNMKIDIALKEFDKRAKQDIDEGVSDLIMDPVHYHEFTPPVRAFRINGVWERWIGSGWMTLYDEANITVENVNRFLLRDRIAVFGRHISNLSEVLDHGPNPTNTDTTKEECIFYEKRNRAVKFIMNQCNLVRDQEVAVDQYGQKDSECYLAAYRLRLRAYIERLNAIDTPLREKLISMTNSAYDIISHASRYKFISTDKAVEYSCKISKYVFSQKKLLNYDTTEILEAWKGDGWDTDKIEEHLRSFNPIRAFNDQVCPSMNELYNEV